MIILDTDVMIDLLRQYPPAVAWLESFGDEEIVMPGFVIMEVIQGCSNKVEQEQVERKLANYGRLWPSAETCDEALSTFIRFHLSHGLGIIDTIIGQTAVNLGSPLFTFNQKHYTAIPNLQIKRPYLRKL